MKKLVAVAMLLGVVIMGTAQIRTIPSVVTDSLKSRYPNAKTVSWKDNLTNFEASFTNSNTDYSAKFNSKGEWLESEKKISFNDLNSDVQDGFHKSRFSDWEIRGIKEIREKDKEVIYRILVRKSSLQKKYLYFNKNGQLQKESTAV